MNNWGSDSVSDQPEGSSMTAGGRNAFAERQRQQDQASTLRRCNDGKTVRTERTWEDSGRPLKSAAKVSSVYWECELLQQ